jgi:hypothetical protein
MLHYGRKDLASGRVRWTNLTPAEWCDRDERAVAELKRAGFETIDFRSRFVTIELPPLHERAVVLSEVPVLRILSELGRDVTDDGLNGWNSTLEEVERNILSVLKETNWVFQASGVAALLVI